MAENVEKWTQDTMQQNQSEQKKPTESNIEKELEKGNGYQRTLTEKLWDSISKLSVQLGMSASGALLNPLWVMGFAKLTGISAAAPTGTMVAAGIMGLGGAIAGFPCGAETMDRVIEERNRNRAKRKALAFQTAQASSSSR